MNDFQIILNKLEETKKVNNYIDDIKKVFDYLIIQFKKNYHNSIKTLENIIEKEKAHENNTLSTKKSQKIISAVKNIFDSSLVIIFFNIID